MATDYKFRITAQDKTKGAFNSVNKNVNSTTKAMKKLAGAFAGVVAVRQLVQFGKESLQLADDIGKVADKLGVTTDFLQRMQFAAEQTGIATNTLNMGLQRFTRRVAEARNGTGEAKAALEQLGIALNDSEGNARSIEDVLADVSDGLAATADSGEKVRLAFKFFDSEGVALVSTLGDGAAALKALTESATGVIPEDTIRKAEEFNDTMNRLKRQVLMPLRTAFINVSNAILDFAEAMGLIKPDLFGKSLEELNSELTKENALLKQQEETLKKITDIRARVPATAQRDKTKERIEDLKEAISLQENQLNIQNKINKSITETPIEPLEKINAIVKENITIVKSFADTVEGQLTNAFTDFFDLTTEKFGDFKELATSVARAVINELIQVFIVQKAVGMVKGTISEMGSIISGDFGAAVDALSGRASGGPVNANTPYLVGEKGPEIFMPSSNGNIIPNNQLSTQSAPVVNFNISTVDAAGFDQLLTSRKGLITSIINNAMNTQGKMGVV